VVSEKGQLHREFARHANGANSPPHTCGAKGQVEETQDWDVHNSLKGVQLGGNQTSLQHKVFGAELEHTECISPIKGNFLL